MPNAYFEDVTEAVLTALNHFEHSRALTPQHFEVATVNIMHDVRGRRWDYGHPAMYQLHRCNLEKLGEWWSVVAPAGTILPPQWKSTVGAYEVNMQCFGTGGRMFNYHVALA